MTQGSHPNVHTFTYNLTAVELEIILYLSHGKKRGEIAGFMGVRTKTIDQRIYRIMDKLGAATGAGLVGIALRRGIIQ